MSNTIKYVIGDVAYLNITNRCSNKCTFCIRNNHDGIENYRLWLDKEPTVNEILESLKDVENYKEVVFCGFGEPMYRIDDVVLIADYIHSKGVKTRINTNGQASLISGDNVAKKLQGKIDTINISLNETTAQKYQEICQSVFGEAAYYSMIDFARECAKYVPRVILSIVDIVGEDSIKRAKKIAEDLGVELRVRTLIK